MVWAFFISIVFTYEITYEQIPNLGYVSCELASFLFVFIVLALGVTGLYYNIFTSFLYLLPLLYAFDFKEIAIKFTILPYLIMDGPERVRTIIGLLIPAVIGWII